MRALPALAVLVTVLAAAAPSSAQVPVGLDPTLNVLYLQQNVDDAGSCCIQFLSTTLEDPNGGIDYVSYFLQTANFPDWVFAAELPALVAPVVLDVNKDIEFYAFVGGAASTPVTGPIESAAIGTMTLTLSADGATIGTGSADFEAIGGSAEAKVTVKPTQAVIEGGSILTWTLQFSGNSVGTSFTLYSDRGEQQSRIVLPVVSGGIAAPAAPKTHYSNEAGDIRFEKPFVTESSDTFKFNWTAGTAADLAIDTTLGDGVVAYLVKDGKGKEVWSGTVADDDSASKQVSSAGAGTWTIQLDLTDFSGRLYLNATKVTAPGSTTPTSPTSGTGPTPTGTLATPTAGDPGSGPDVNEGPPTTAKKEDSPGVALLAALAAVGVALVVARRQR